MSLAQTAPKKIYIWIPQSQRTPWANTLWYLNMNQSDADFTDYEGHTVSNNWITYNARGKRDWCGYNNSNWKRLYSDFWSWESFPSQFTIMAFMKPTWTHYTDDHPMWISLANDSTKVTWGIWFNQSNSQVQFNYLKENVAWNTSSYSYSPLNVWHHYALTYDGTTMKGYIDGNEVTSLNVSGSGSGAWPSWWFTVFWRNHDNYTNTIQWYVDEAIVEDKVWTSQDIKDYLWPLPTYLAYYKFNGNLYDDSWNQNDCSGTPYWYVTWIKWQALQSTANSSISTPFTQWNIYNWPFALAFCVKMLNTATLQRIFKLHNDSHWIDIQYEFYNDFGWLQVYNNNTVTRIAFPMANPWEWVWKKFVLTGDGTNQIELYIDGVKTNPYSDYNTTFTYPNYTYPFEMWGSDSTNIALDEVKIEKRHWTQTDVNNYLSSLS